MIVHIVTELFLKENEDVILYSQCDNQLRHVAYLLILHVHVFCSILSLVLKARGMGTLMIIRRG